MMMRSRPYLLAQPPGLLRAGLERAHLLPPLPPPTPFVGREQELSQAQSHLALHQVVGITGLAGSGKSALAATLLAQHPGRRCWIDLRPGLGGDVDSLLWALAAPLIDIAPRTRRVLHHILQSGWAYPPLVRLQLILDGYTAHPQPVLCVLDGYERAGGPGTGDLISTLCEYVARTHATGLMLIVVGRRLPGDLSPYELRPLAGINSDAVQQWADRVAPTLISSSVTQISQISAGLPALVSRIFAAAGAGTEPLEAILHDEVRRFTLAIMANLTLRQQRLLAHLATRPDPRAPLQLTDLATLTTLERQHLVQIDDTAVFAHPLMIRYFQQIPFGAS